MVLLRTAIGWHFLYEGLEKMYPPDGKEFSAEGYLRGSAGPFAPFFRAHVPDVDGVARLTLDENNRPIALKAQWAAELNDLEAYYTFTPPQSELAEKALKTSEAKADAWFRNVENLEKVKKYEADLARVKAIESDRLALDYQRKLAYKDRKTLDTTRKEINGEIDALGNALRKEWLSLVNTESSPPPKKPASYLDRVNEGTKIVLTFAGAGLLLGLFSRISALGAAGFLLMTYLTMPPFPGLPAPPNSEGHYLIVNKNLIEMLACFAIASLPTGQWIGIDSLLFGWIGRRADARRLAREERAAALNLPLEPETTRSGQTPRRPR